MNHQPIVLVESFLSFISPGFCSRHKTLVAGSDLVMAMFACLICCQRLLFAIFIDFTSSLPHPHRSTFINMSVLKYGYPNPSSRSYDLSQFTGHFRGFNRHIERHYHHLSSLLGVCFMLTPVIKHDNEKNAIYRLLSFIVRFKTLVFSSGFPSQPPLICRKMFWRRAWGWPCHTFCEFSD